MFIKKDSIKTCDENDTNISFECLSKKIQSKYVTKTIQIFRYLHHSVPGKPQIKQSDASSSGLTTPEHNKTDEIPQVMRDLTQPIQQVIAARIPLYSLARRKRCSNDRCTRLKQNKKRNHLVFLSGVYMRAERYDLRHVIQCPAERTEAVTSPGLSPLLPFHFGMFGPSSTAALMTVEMTSGSKSWTSAHARRTKNATMQISTEIYIPFWSQSIKLCNARLEEFLLDCSLGLPYVPYFDLFHFLPKIWVLLNGKK
ncbi:hypothetical protein AVEN_87936-1 [Araneus ventricosus]|uniref:Uncharacterized protein n=1 Tax=Araneus ventricosus TaxID=182803 RepID=A0A4Y2TWK4_ARAVE|nr:hypothetical protein AVEN_87936-1 [Araneus ventricosus]